MTLAYLMEWAHLLIRWAHVVIGIAWIGASFYFVWLESHLEREGKREGIAGDLWAIHGGGFYFLQKYKNAPEQLPTTLHWFKYEAYFTWITGMLLLAVVYYFNADTYLIDANKLAMSSWLAIFISLAAGALGWFAYHALANSKVGSSNLKMFAVMTLVITLMALVLTLVFQDRAAFLQVGAIMGTMMAGNVFFVIIPNQKKAVVQMIAGETPAPQLGRQALQRSLHNNYLTLPVIFLMISNHYPLFFGHEWNWLILILISLIGVGIRHWFNLKNQGKSIRGAWSLLASLLGIFALMLLMAPKDFSAGNPVAFQEVRSIVDQNCLSCHAAEPSVWPGPAPKGVMFDEAASIQAYAAQIKQQAVLTHTMPMPFDGPVTMSDADRATLGRWIDQGANL